MADTETTDNLDLDTPVEVADKPREPTTYERQLRKEAATYRARAKAEAEARETAVAKATADAEARIAEANVAATQRVIRAEMKAAAIAAGIVDLDALRLLDISTVKLNDDGTVEGADALLAEARKSRPWMFGNATQSTTTTATAPKSAPAVEKKATDMTSAERAAALAKLRRM